MKQAEGLVHDFLAAKMVNLITYAEDGSRRSRPMTNFNEDPYGKMWFATFSTTDKVKEIEKDPRVFISFPSSTNGKFWEIEGKANFESDEEVSERWKWWYLYWHPEAEKKGWELEGDASYVDDRKIIDVQPISAKLVDMPKMGKTVK
jgi:general stress protein 26